MKALIIGANGQLGYELVRTVPENVRAAAVDFPDIDITDSGSIGACFDAHTPEVVINAAAYTHVDGAENDREAAYGVNRDGAKNLAERCRRDGVRMVQISTDFVFSGRHFRPYKPEDAPDPLSVYGGSKQMGEKAVLDALGREALVIRTAWLYSAHGNNFVKTMLRLMKERDRLTIVDDQVGTPTWAFGLAEAVWKAVDRNLTGIHHWTDAGIASWYDFSVAIQDAAVSAGMLDKKIPILPIPSEQYPTPAERPFYSVLDKRSIWDALEPEPVHWRVQLQRMVRELWTSR